MSGHGFQPRIGVSPWLPVGVLFWIILILTIFVTFHFAGGGQGLGALSFVAALISLLFRLLVIALLLSPLFLALFSTYFDYTLLIKKKQ